MEIIKNRLRHFGRLQTGTDLLEESQSVIVPDSCPDVLQIIGTDSWLNVQEKSCSQKVLRIGGQVNCTVCCHSVEGKTPYSVPVTVPFSYVKEIEGMEESDRLMANIKVLNISVLMINPRKLLVKALLQVVYECYCSQSMEYIEEIVQGEAEGMECLRQKQPMHYIADIMEKRLVLNDEIRLSSPLPNERSMILHRETEWITEDVRQLPGKIMLRGHIDLALTTIDDKGGFIGKSRYSVPFSQIIECEGVGPEDTVEVTYAPVREEVELFTSSDQVTTMQISFAAITECRIIKTRELLFVGDIFSTKWELKTAFSELSTPAEGTEHVVQIPVRETVMAQEDAARILSVSVEPEYIAAHRGDPVLGAGFHVCVVYTEADGSVMTIGRKIYVEGSCEVPLSCGGLCRAAAGEPSATITGNGEIQVMFDAELRCRELHGEVYKILGSVAVKKESPKDSTGRPSLIVRRAEGHENVWAIAKSCNTSPSALAQSNRLREEDIPPEGSLLLIPFVSR